VTTPTKTYAPGQPHTGPGSEETPATWKAHPGTDYFVNRVTGTIQREGGLGGLLSRGNPAWAGPFDWDQAKSFASGSTGSGAIHGTAGGALGAVTSVAQFVGRLGEAHTWVRIGEFVIGLALFIVGLSAVAGHTRAGQAATKIAGKAALL
jgi:hypothetical protein